MTLSKDNVLAIIPARGGSKGIHRKNIRKLAGKPLLSYTVEAAKSSKWISRIYLSTDDEEIAAIGRTCDLEVPCLRPAHLSTDDASALSVIQYEVKRLEERENYSPDYIIYLQPTSPFRTAEQIDASLEQLVNTNADSIVSVTEVPHIFNPYSIMTLKDGVLYPYQQYDEHNNIRQKKPVFYARNGAAIYAFTYECLVSKDSIYGDKTIPFFMNKVESIDLDDMLDWEIAEMILEKKLIETKK